MYNLRKYKDNIFQFIVFISFLTVLKFKLLIIYDVYHFCYLLIIYELRLFIMILMSLEFFSFQKYNKRFIKNSSFNLI